MSLRNPIKLLLAGLVGACIVSAATGPVRAAEIADDTCLQCHSDNTLTKTNKAGKEVSVYVEPSVLKASVHKVRSCAACHPDITEKHPDDKVAVKPVDCRGCHASHSATYDASVHGIALKSGNDMAPACADCHGRHNVLPPTAPASPLHFSNLAKTCGQCHTQESEDVQASVHGRAAAQGERNSATCIDCHNEHQIESLKGASAYKISIEICSKCHASASINAKFHMPNDRVSTFLGSYHGLTVQGRATGAANCASCHGYHKILRSTDPASSVNKNNLVKTCGRCHPGATENFAFSRVHTDEVTGSDEGATANRWVRRIYLALIFSVVGGLSLHNLLAWLQSAIAARRARGPLAMRMSRNHRIQHFILLSSFILLALTGFALKYPESWLASLFVAENIRRWVHRGAGVVLIGLGLFHLIHIIVTREGRKLVCDFMPRWRDLGDLMTNFRYFIGRRERPAKTGRFGYPEKLEYWAVVWGIVIMGVTGLMIWFKMDVTRFVPRWIVELAVTVHYYEAILACLAIVVWHFYQVIFAPDVYPMNWAWWDGKVPEHWHEEEPSPDKSINGKNTELADAGKAKAEPKADGDGM